MSSRLRVIASLAIVVLFSAVARADFTYTESASYAPVASLLLTNSSNTNNQGQCASTSMMNSFLYLQNTYPSTYTNSGGSASLTMNTTSGTALINQRNMLDSNIVNGPQGGLQGDTWNAKVNWVASTAGSGSTSLVGITNTAMNSSQGTGYTQLSGSDHMTFGASGTDIWNFLTQQIKEGEDVEIGMYDHMVTLMGISTSGANMYAEIIDPNYPTGTGTGAGPGSGPGGNGPVGEWVNATYGTNGGLVHLSGFAIGGTGYNTPDIYYAFAESPAPEPSTIALLVVGAGCLGGLAWRRRKKDLSRKPSVLA
jgi:hypothetical protein